MKSMIATVVLVLALASTLTTGGQAGTLEQDTPEWERYWSQLRRVYNRVKTADIAYEPSGTRSRFVGEINPPFVTPDPDQVEVIAFITYGNEAWITNYVLMTKWAKTLPSDVTVRYLPKKSLWQNNPHPRAQPLRAVRQNLYHTALAMGVSSWKAHHAVAFFVTRDVWALEGAPSQRRYARRLRLDADEFQATRQHPAARFEGQVADWIELAHLTEKWRVAKNVAGVAERSRYTHFPELLIGGKYIVSTSLRRKPTESYQMANWAIGQSLEDLDANRHWPRNAEELAAWLAPRKGQILSRWVNGKHQDDVAGIVYDAKAEAIWILDRGGVVRDVATLTRDEHGTHFTYEKRGRVEYFDIWRLTRQYLPWTPTDGTTTIAQRHGAFLLTDHLVNTSTPVELWSDGNPWQVTFAPAGAVHADTDRGPRTGQWRLQGNFVAVELEDGRGHAWRWLNIAHAAGFKMPTEGIQPWKVPQRFAEADPTQGQPEAVRASETRKTALLREIKAVQERTEKAIRAAFQKNEEEFSKAAQTATQKLIQRIEQGHDRR